MGAGHIIDYSKVDPVNEVLKITAGSSVDVAIEALGKQETFEACLRSLWPEGCARLKLGDSAPTIITQTTQAPISFHE